jgi:hypothetical protein
MKVYVKDGDDLLVIVRLDFSLDDPMLECPAVAQQFRVIANSFGPTLKLVPVQEKVTKITDLSENI